VLYVNKMDWRQLEEFKGIDLNDSFVLGWKQSLNELSFELKASIWPESIFYEAPKANEYTCYRKATLSFSEIKSVVGLTSIESARYSTDPDGSIDYGNIDSLDITENGFNVVGDFGEVIITGGVFSFEIHI
jgi:hypothetical protein